MREIKLWVGITMLFLAVSGAIFLVYGFIPLLVIMAVSAWVILAVYLISS